MKHKKIIDDMHKAMESKPEKRRTYLGMSQSRPNCYRKVWLEFRHAFDVNSSFSSISHWEDGHHSESVVSQRIINGGYDLTVESDEGGQFEMQDLYWWRGHCDGIIVIDGEKYVWEHKCTSAEKLTKLKKLIEKYEHLALADWDATYFAQAQNYMHYLGIHKHVLTASHHGSREIVNSKGDYTTAIVETIYDPAEFELNRSEAHNIIVTDKMPPPAWSLEFDKPLCIWKTGKCEAYDFCKGRHIGKPNCRNCGYCEFTTEGANCTKTGDVLDEQEMVEFKDCHRYHPEFILNYELINVTDEGNMVYRNDSGDEIINGNSMEFYDEFNEGNS